MSFPTRATVCLLALVAPGGLMFAACGGGDDHVVLTPVKAQYLPVVITDDVAVGLTRFSLGLLDQANGDAPVVNAQLHMRFFEIHGSEGTLRFEADPRSVVVTKTYTHTHADGTVETHEAGTVGSYVANVTFDVAGQWGVEVTGTVDGKAIEPVRPVFSVNAKSVAPGVGDPAPRSHQTILNDVTDIRQIDTSQNPIPEMHDMTIADAVTSGKPTVIVFATPAFCTSMICGPTKDTVDQLYDKFKGQVNFVNVEPYYVAEAQQGKLCAVPVFSYPTTAPGPTGCPAVPEGVTPDQSWNLGTEPWVFLVDKNGKVAARFDGIVLEDELEQALQPLVS